MSALIILFISLTFVVQAQDLTSDTLEARRLSTNLPEDKEEAHKRLEQAATLYKKHNLTELYYATYFQVLHKKSFEDITSMLNAWKSILEEVKEKLGATHLKTTEAYIHTANTHYNVGQLAPAIEYYKLAEKNLEQSPNPDLRYLTKLYVSTSRCYFRMGDDARVKDYIEAAEKAAKKAHSNPLLLAPVLKQKARMYANQPVALDWIKKAIKIVEKELGKDNPEVFFYLEVQGVIHYFLGQSAEAISTMKELAARQEKHYGSINEFITRTYINIGAMYKDWVVSNDIEQKERDSIKAAQIPYAIEYHLKAAYVYEQLDGKHNAHKSLSVLYRNLGFIYLERQHNYSKALDAFQESLLALLPNIDKESIKPTALIEVANNKQFCFDKELALEAMKGRIASYIMMYKEDLSASTFEQAAAQLNEMDALISDYTKTLADDGLMKAFKYRNEFVTFNALELYKVALEAETAAATSYLNTLFQLIEKNKNIRLLSSFQSKEASKLGQISADFLEEEKSLKSEIAKVQKKILQAKNTANIDNYKKELRDLRTAYEDFLRKLKEEAPKYYELKYQSNIPDLKKVQQQLDSKTAIIEYQFFKNQLFGISITADTLIVKDCTPLTIVKDSKTGKKRKTRPKLLEYIKELRTILTHPQLLKIAPEKAYKEYVHNAEQLYKIISIKDLVPSKKIDHLIIVPSANLNHIPFEILLKSTPEDTTKISSYQDLDYLIKHYKISYTYSTSLWMQTNLLHPKNNKGILGFAASYDKKFSSAQRSSELEKTRELLIDLPGARKELEALQANYAGDFYFGENANERQFKKLDRSQYSVIHLAMHGLLNKEHPFASSLAFTENGDSTEDNFVFAYELTQMPLESDLVVLSACETGYGKFAYGEGVASLARSFMYAGTPSLIMTLWEVNDHSTAEIMQLFYEGLHNSLDKPTALQQAKIKYLNKAKGIASHPFFWAPFLQLGNTEAITLRSKNYAFYQKMGIGSVAVLFLLISYFIYRSKRKKRELT